MSTRTVHPWEKMSVDDMEVVAAYSHATQQLDQAIAGLAQAAMDLMEQANTNTYHEACEWAGIRPNQLLLAKHLR